MVMIKIAWDLDECSFMFVALLRKKKTDIISQH